MGDKIVTIGHVVVALAFIVLLAILCSIIFDKLTNTSTKLNSTLESADTTTVSEYDGTILEGSSVVTAINNAKNIGGDRKIYAAVHTVLDASGKVTVYGYNNGFSSKKCKEADGSTDLSVNAGASGASINASTLTATNTLSSNPNAFTSYTTLPTYDVEYINPSAMYESELSYNTNKILEGIIFCQIED